MALAIYRKYRPKKFSEVLGQDYLVEILRNAAKRRRFSHAYLFYGPRGSGKTTTARLVAKAINCLTAESLDHGEPCNQCAACVEIGNGRALDIIEIDAASNRGIDEIRNLKEVIKVSPAVLKYKVFIVDETHMLTKEAFNALLKILEEPPEHAVIILATTEYEKVPATISSRTQRFLLQRLAISQIVEKLKTVTKAEGLKIDDEALELVAAAADGSLRDAESLLDQVAAMAGKADLKTVEQIIGRVGFRRVLEIADYIDKGDLKNCLVYLKKLKDEGANLPDLAKELIDFQRKILSLKLNPDLEELFNKDLTKEEMEKLKVQAKNAQVEKQIALIKSLLKAYGEMRYSPLPHVPLEIALIESLKN